VNRALAAAASGMSAEEQRLDVIADNLANADVAGFKSSVMTSLAVSDGEHGFGTVVVGKNPVWRQGKLAKSGGPFDVAIDGTGFFALRRADGTRIYTRDGEFSRSADGLVRNAAGAVLEGVHIPANALRVSVATDGKVLVDTPSVQHVKAGRISLTVFPAPQNLLRTPDGAYLATHAAGRGFALLPGSGQSGRLMFGMLERSNVNVMESMMEILSAQRAFEANSKGVQAADEMLRIANNIQRS